MKVCLYAETGFLNIKLLSDTRKYKIKYSYSYYNHIISIIILCIHIFQTINARLLKISTVIRYIYTVKILHSNKETNVFRIITTELRDK